MEPSREIAALRKKLDMSQRELGDRLGVARETVARWETGIVTAPPFTIELLERLVLEKKWSAGPHQV